MSIFLVPALVFLSVTLGLIAIYVWATPNKARKRVQEFSNSSSKAEWKAALVNIIGPFARLSVPDGDWESSPLRIKFTNAGIRSNDATFLFFGAKTLLPIAMATMAWISLTLLSQVAGMTLLLGLSIAALVGCYLPNLYLHLRIRARKREIFENFPDAADLMLVCIEAGLGLDAGFNRVAEEMRIQSIALAEELHLTNLEMRAGATREKSLRNLALRTGVEEVGTFAIMMTQADKFGTSIGESLRVFSDDLRHKRQTRAEELAAKIPTKMLFPLVVFIFPSICMVVLGPAVIRIIRTVVPLMGGQS
jgi:tight adherence protein C